MIEKEDLVKKSFELFRLNGIKAISMENVAQKAGISKKTLYQFFDNKEQLIVECLNKEKYRWEERLKEISAEESNPLICLTRMLYFILNELSAYGNSWYYDIKKNYFPFLQAQKYENYIHETYLLPLLQMAVSKNMMRPEYDLKTAGGLMRSVIDFFAVNFDRFDEILFDDFFTHSIVYTLRGASNLEQQQILDLYLAENNPK